MKINEHDAGHMTKIAATPIYGKNTSKIFFFGTGGQISTKHYANMSVQYTAIFHGCKNGNFQMKKCDIFLIFAQNIDRWYTLEPPQ